MPNNNKIDFKFYNCLETQKTKECFGMVIGWIPTANLFLHLNN